MDIPPTDQIKFYGTGWCPTSRRAKTQIEKSGLPYQFIDIDKDMAARKTVEEINNGNRSVPTIIFSDGSVLVEPSRKELEKKLNSYI